jgi:hypothetical protein
MSRPSSIKKQRYGAHGLPRSDRYFERIAWRQVLLKMRLLRARVSSVRGIVDLERGARRFRTLKRSRG